MTLLESVSLFGVMFALALIPSSSVLVVTTRAITNGFCSGVFAAIGIVVGDLVFVLLAIFGLAELTEIIGRAVILIKYLGAVYLAWLGISLLRAKPSKPYLEKSSNFKESNQVVGSFFAGLLLTIGDIKAIFFYLSLLPAFVDLEALIIREALLICAITVFSVGSAKVGYAFFATRAGMLANSQKLQRGLTATSGLVLIGVGMFLAIKV